MWIGNAEKLKGGQRKAIEIIRHLENRTDEKKVETIVYRTLRKSIIVCRYIRGCCKEDRIFMFP